jgi:hypothetical protein
VRDAGSAQIEYLLGLIEETLKGWGAHIFLFGERTPRRRM